MEKKHIHNKLHTSIAVTTTLVTLMAFNKQTVQAEETDAFENEEAITEVKEKESAEKNESDKEDTDNEKNESSKEDESDVGEFEASIEQDVESDEDDDLSEESTETDEVDDLSKESTESAEDDGLSEEDTTDNQEAVEVEEVREATMTVFSARISVKPEYTTSFINTIAPIAMNIGEEYGLYPSVIIAQAALESGWGGHSPALPDDYELSLPPNYNLFGVKGNYNGESVGVKTKEYDPETEEYIDVVDEFKKYPSYTESLLDYANKMVHNTTTTDPYFYSGTWVENTEDYRDATEFLTGRYATDPTYGDKLNKLIEDYDLEQYDDQVYNDEADEPSDTKPDNDEEKLGEYENIVDNQVLAYYATLNENTLIYNVPGFNEGFEIVATANDLSSRNVSVKEEVITDTQTWAKIELNNHEVGWVATADLTPNYLEIQSTNEVAYNAQISNPNINIYNQPAWTEGNQLVGNSEDYMGEQLIVKEEAQTVEATYAKIELNGEILGWINKNGLTEKYDTISETHEVAYNAEITNSNINIYSTPAWTEGNKLTAYASDYIGEELVATKEIVTSGGVYVLIEYNGEELGWINRNGITGKYDTIQNTRDVAYNAKITNTNINIYDRPAWTRGNRLTVRSSDLVEEELTVTQEVVTEEATYAKIALEGQALGWINVGGISINYDAIEEQREAAYNATIINPNINIYSKPAWTKGSELVAESKNYMNKNLVVKKEIVTTGGTYAQIETEDQVLGWININGITGRYDTISTSREVAYNAEFINPNINIYNVPAWTRGNRLTARTSDYIGQNAIVKKEAVTEEGTYARVDVGGQTLGWINTKGISPNYYEVKDTKEVSYVAKITNTGSNIYSAPAWTAGNELVAYSSDYVGEPAFVTKELTTEEATYALITVNGATLGWINTNTLNRTPVIYLDAGHGGSDSGATSGGVYEKDLNLSVSKKVEKLLKDKNYTVVTARDVDEFITLSGRAQEANSIGADIFVSIHHNSFNGSAHGIETYYYNEQGNSSNPKANDKNRIQDSKKLAEDIHRELIAETGANDRGVKRGNFHVIRETEMPAVLVEGGFVDNAAERAKLVLESYQQKLAEAITNGIEKFLNLWF